MPPRESSDKHKIAQKVENLVANAFVGDAEGGVEVSVGGRDDGDVEGAALDEPAVAEGLEIGLEGEGARGSHLVGVSVGLDRKHEGLASDGGVGKIEVAGDGEVVPGIGGQRGEFGGVVAEKDGFGDRPPGGVGIGLVEESGFEKSLGERGGAAVEDGEFASAVDLNVEIGDAESGAGAEEMFRGFESPAAGVLENGAAEAVVPSDEIEVGLDGVFGPMIEGVEAEAGVRGCGVAPDSGAAPGVNAGTFKGTGRLLEGALEQQGVSGVRE
jgi:hypothetical protein